jgi:hypothetical protein
VLPDSDIAFLDERGIAFELDTEANMTCVIIPAWPLPPGYNRSHADLLLRLSAGYPDIPPDMWWFDPAIALATGQSVQATELIESYLGRSWQRWSRHFVAGQWQSGIDGLESYFALIRAELHRCVPEPAQ